MQMNLDAALSCHQQGNLAQAELMYREALRADPRHAEALHLLGVVALQTGRAEAALESINRSLVIDPQQAIAHLNRSAALRELKRPLEALQCLDLVVNAAPDYAEAWNNHGDLLLQMQRPLEALASLQRAVALQPEFTLAWRNLGNALRELGRAQDAMGSYEIALRLAPNSPPTINSLGCALRDLKRIDEALTCFDQALQADPCYLPALYNRGNALLQLRRYDEALICMDQYLLLSPDDADVLTHRGIALLNLKQYSSALVSFEHALRLRPQFARALNNRGNALRHLKQAQSALISYEQALALTPDDAETHSNRGNALIDLNRPREALESYDRAIRLDPQRSDFFHNRGSAWLALDVPEEALTNYRSALQINPDCAEALISIALTHTKLHQFGEALAYYEHLHRVDASYPYAIGLDLYTRQMDCRWADVAELRSKVLAQVTQGFPATDPFALLSITDDLDAQLQCARQFVLEDPATRQVSSWCARSFKHQRIRLAYVSADLRNHPVSRLLVGLFEQHDRRSFEVIAVSLRAEEPSAFGQRVKNAFDRFIDASGMSDAALISCMRELQIDIAVDLMGFTEGQRSGIFAQRVAPVQVNYLGFPGTMGAQFMDYIIADRFVVPELLAAQYAECIAYLPYCFQVSDSRRPLPATAPTRAQLGLPQSGFVWCCFNSTYKFNVTMFDVWMRLLQDVPESVLWLIADESSTQANLGHEALLRGVTPERLVITGRTTYEQYLAQLSVADVFLDTVPFNGGATACDALWAGLPVLTCSGDAFASRMAGSLLNAIGLPELVTESLEAYERCALQLVRDRTYLLELRQRLANNRHTMPLFDTRTQCAQMEAAYRHMWSRAQCGEVPESFALQPCSAS